MTRQIQLSASAVEQLLADMLEVNREISKGGVACDISNRAYPAIQRTLTTLRAALTREQLLADRVSYQQVSRKGCPALTGMQQEVAKLIIPPRTTDWIDSRSES